MIRRIKTLKIGQIIKPVDTPLRITKIESYAFNKLMVYMIDGNGILLNAVWSEDKKMEVLSGKSVI